MNKICKNKFQKEKKKSNFQNGSCLTTLQEHNLIRINSSLQQCFWGSLILFLILGNPSLALRTGKETLIGPTSLLVSVFWFTVFTQYLAFLTKCILIFLCVYNCYIGQNLTHGSTNTRGHWEPMSFRWNGPILN